MTGSLDKENLFCPKGRFRFRLGTTSYIIPDEILPNLRHLCERVDDIELVLFESDEFSNLPSPEDIKAMEHLAGEHDLSFTVHLPLDTHTGNANEEKRFLSVQKHRKVIELTKPLNPISWVLHLAGDQRGEPPSDNLARWEDQHRKSIEELLDTGIEPFRISVETLDYSFDHAFALVEEFDLSVCLDMGHILINGRDADDYLDRGLPRARVLHLHGIDGANQDHVSLRFFPSDLLKTIFTRLTQLPDARDRVVTLEVFGEQDFEDSLQIIKERCSAWLKSFC